MIKAFLFIIAASVSSSAFAMSVVCRNDVNVPAFNLQINQNPNGQPLGLLRVAVGPFANVTCGNLMNNISRGIDSICSGVYANDSDANSQPPRAYYETPVSIRLTATQSGWLADFTLPVYSGGAEVTSYCQIYR